MNKGFQKAITNGIHFLAKEQGKDGSFFSLTSFNPLNFKKAKKYQTIFLNALILSCLNKLAETPQIKNIKDKLARFLLSQRSEHWSFNYWARNSKEANVMPYPDDLDDTFCALAALYEYKQRLIDGSVLARVVTILTALEEKEGGPYRTWLVPPTAEAVWKDIDLAVNSNIAYFLSLHDIVLPKVKKFIEDAIDRNTYTSPYYPSECVIIYFISRWYHGEKKKKTIAFLLEKQKNSAWKYPLATALAISAFLNFGIRSKKISRTIGYLLDNQNKNGSWEPFAFCIDPVIKGEKHYAGSSSLTTAFCLEAISKFNKSQIPNYKSQTNPKSQILNPEEGEIYNKVMKNYGRRFAEFSKDFQEKAIASADKILTPLEVAAPRSSGLATKSRARLLTGLKKNKDIVLLPFYFRNALGAISRKVSDDLIVQLGVANLFGWVAYTIYDDFLDDEGSPRELPLANVCLRESAEIFKNILPENNDYQKLCRKIFDGIDAANYQEKLKYNYNSLAEKSMGHALGPLAIMFVIKASRADIKNLIAFFRNYIIARQLNDDAHDWEDDLKRGQVNAVAAMLLKDVKGNMSDPKKLREIFWHKTIAGVCKDILRRAKLARNDLKKLSIVEEPAVFSGMLAAIEQSAEKTLKEREETIKFLKTYNLR